MSPGIGDYAEAVGAYEAGSDWDSVVRLYLEQLQAPQKAAALVRKGCTRNGALRLAQYCMTAKDYQVRPSAMMFKATFVSGDKWVVQ